MMMSQDSTRPHSSSCACRQFCTIVRTHASSTRRSFSWNEYAYTSVFWRLLSRWGNGAIEMTRWDRLFLENYFFCTNEEEQCLYCELFFFYFDQESTRYGLKRSEKFVQKMHVQCTMFTNHEIMLQMNTFSNKRC